MQKFFLFCFLILGKITVAQYAPQVGQSGSSALHHTNPVFTSWADSFYIQRGWVNILDTTLGLTTVGWTGSAKIPDQSVLSLGDGGIAIAYVHNPIVNKPGPDFAIFENGFYNLTDSNLAFLELAFVEVSEDGQNYYRFESSSLTDTTTQVGGFSNTLNASKIHNLAGKYIGGYGTPFDLEDLANQPIDLNNIHFIKIIDVVGSIQDGICRYDYYGRKINDPFPTPFPSGGFDLDAIGIIHQLYALSDNHLSLNDEISIFPNPCFHSIHISGLLLNEHNHYVISDYKGSILSESEFTNTIPINDLASGHYLLTISNYRKRKTFNLVKK
jgi:hypothetical protein